MKKTLILIVAAIVVVFLLFGGNSDDKTSDDVASSQSLQINDDVEIADNEKDNKVDSQPNPNAEYEADANSDDVPRDYQSALNKAKYYSDSMHMSKAGLYDQLTSEYGEKFTADEAQYAVDNLVTDYNRNALEIAKSYLEMDMSPEAIRDQLTSEYGEQFTQEEADYAIANLPN